MSSPTISISAPGKVILHGEHSVVYGKMAVAATLGLRTRLEYWEVPNSQAITINFVNINLLHVYSLQDVYDLLKKPLPLLKPSSTYNFNHPDLLDYDKVLDSVQSFIKSKCGSKPLDSQQEVALTSLLYLYWAFIGPLEFDLVPFTLKLQSDLSIGAGTGSSASFAVSLASFFLQLIRVKKFKSKPEYKSYKVGTDLKTFDKNELDLISRWAFHSEKIVHGTPSGVDNTICTFGGLVKFRKGSVPKLITLTSRFRIILVNTKVSRNTKRLVEIAARRREKFTPIIELVLESMDLVAGRAVQIIKNINGGSGDELQDYEALGELIEINMNLLRCLGASHPKLDEICFVLKSCDLSAKLTGAGGGGYAVCLVPPHFDEDVVKGAIEDLNSRGFEAVLTDLGGCGVSIN